jgi:prepilin-type N-terminal cleavage/methylation domain-containing protein
LSRHSQYRQGFTLIEVVLAIGLSAMVVYLLSTATELYLANVDASRGRVESAQLARTLLDQIAADLAAARAYAPVAAPASGGGPGQPQQFGGAPGGAPPDGGGPPQSGGMNSTAPSGAGSPKPPMAPRTMSSARVAPRISRSFKRRLKMRLDALLDSSNGRPPRWITARARSAKCSM